MFNVIDTCILYTQYVACYSCMGYEYMHLDPGIYIKESPIKLPAFGLSIVVMSTVVDVSTGVTATHTVTTESSSPETMSFTKLNTTKRNIRKNIEIGC